MVNILGKKMKINKEKSVQFITFRKNGNIIRQPLHINEWPDKL